MVIILTGGKGVGKSSALFEAAEFAKTKGLTVAGVVSERIFHGEKSVGYNMIDLNSNNRRLLAITLKEAAEEESFKFCSYNFNVKTFEEGISLVEQGLNSDILIVDEIGKIELEGKGWAPAVTKALARGKGKTTILSVREDLTEKVCEKWNITDFKLVNVSAGKKAAEALWDLLFTKGGNSPSIPPQNKGCLPKKCDFCFAHLYLKNSQKV